MPASVRPTIRHLLPALMALLATFATAPAFGQVVINEIMQNPAAVGDAAGEWFELYNAGGSPVDIDGWTIEDNDIDSHVIDNGGPLVIPAGGYLVLGNNADSGTNGGVTVDYTYGSNFFLANGADELVLLDGTLAEMDRVEYDGGPAFPDPNGASMALGDPALDNNVGANWCEASTPFGAGDLGTPGGVNDCIPPGETDIVINEIMQNPAAVGDAAGEWFELYNAGGSPVDIDGWTLQDNDIDSHVINNGGPLVIPAGGYLVLGNNADSGTNGGVSVDYSYGASFFLANGADELVLLDGTLAEVDRVEWDDGLTFPDPNGASMALIDPALDNNAGANWCEASTPFGAGDLGTPGGANDCPLPPPPSALVINEIHADPDSTIAGDANGDGIRDATQDEFVELVNDSASDLDISGWTLNDGFGLRHTFPAGTIVAAGCSIVVFGGGTPTGEFGFGVVQTASTGALGLNNGGDTVTISDGVNPITYTYGGEGGDNQSLTRDPDITGPEPLVKHTTAFGSGGALYSPGTWVDGSLFGGCTVVYADRKIHEVQGNGLVSPEAGNSVAIEGIVVGDFQDGAAGTNGDLNGFFVQEEDSDADGDPATSEGIFVYDGSSPAVNVAVGDLVRVEGVVSEYFELTEITSFSGVSVLGSGNPPPTPAAVTLPVAAVTDLEAFEGMSVMFPQDLFVSGNFTLARFGEVELAVDGPLDTPTNVVAPGFDALALQDLNDRSRIQLDDGSTVQNPLPLPPYLGDGNTLRIGDGTSGLSGVLSYAFGAYEVQPTGPVSFTRVNERPDGPPDVGPSLVTVAGFNVLNYFTTIDTGPPICGPLLDQGCRGADTPEELTRQRDKILAALSILDADVVGLIEIENAPGDEPAADLVAGLNDLLGAGTWDYVPTGAIGTDAIRVAIIYKPASVTPMGAFAVLDSSVDPNFLDDKNRPVLAQSFAENFSGEVFTVAVNHLKSKGSDCLDVGDPDTGDGQGNCNVTRTTAAVALANWLAGDPTASGSDHALILGDLNAYAMEDPVVALESAGYVDLIESLVGYGFAAGAYSYSFDAQAGYLDHALASPALTDTVSGAAFWHINADEPVALDYNTEFNPPLLYQPDEFRSSDHDAAVVGLYEDEDSDGVWDGLDYCPGTAIPESVPEIRLNVNHFALVDGDGLFDTTPPEGEGPGDSFDIYDTAGCSCEQIIEAQGLGKGLRKFGCPPEVMRDWVDLMSSP